MKSHLRQESALVDWKSIMKSGAESIVEKLTNMLRIDKTIRKLRCSETSHRHHLETIISAVAKSNIRDLALIVSYANDAAIYPFEERLGDCKRLESLTLKFVDNVQGSASFHHLMVETLPELVNVKLLEVAVVLNEQHGSGKSCI